MKKVIIIMIAVLIGQCNSIFSFNQSEGSKRTHASGDVDEQQHSGHRKTNGKGYWIGGHNGTDHHQEPAVSGNTAVGQDDFSLR